MITAGKFQTDCSGKSRRIACARLENGAGNKCRKMYLWRFMLGKVLRLQSLYWQRHAARELCIAHAKIAGQILWHALVTGMAGMCHMADGMRSHVTLRKQEGKYQKECMQGEAHAFDYIEGIIPGSIKKTGQMPRLDPVGISAYLAALHHPFDSLILSGLCGAHQSLPISSCNSRKGQRN